MTTIQFREYPEMPEFRHRFRPDNWPADEDYFEVFQTLNDGKWYAVDVTAEGGSARSSSRDSREDAVREIEDRVLKARAFWDQKVEWAANGDMTIPDPKSGRREKPHRVVRVDHKHYVVSDEPSPQDLRRNRDLFGHGGSEFKIRLHDGTEITSHNVWSQGKIPKEYWEALPDNAVFL